LVDAAPKTAGVLAASPRPSTPASIHTHRRHKSAQVVDEGQADAQAISSHPSSSGQVPQSTNVVKSDLASVASAHLQVPQIDSIGREVTSSTASIKSGTVEKGVQFTSSNTATNTAAVHDVNGGPKANGITEPTKISPANESVPSPAPDTTTFNKAAAEIKAGDKADDESKSVVETEKKTYHGPTEVDVPGSSKPPTERFYSASDTITR
jgi:hypothetical protein